MERYEHFQDWNGGKMIPDKDGEWVKAEEALALESRVRELEAWQLAVASGVGFVNFAEGQSGYEVADPDTILNWIFTSHGDES